MLNVLRNVVVIVINKIEKSKTFQLSLKYIVPIHNSLRNASAIKIPRMTQLMLSINFVVSALYRYRKAIKISMLSKITIMIKASKYE